MHGRSGSLFHFPHINFAARAMLQSPPRPEGSHIAHLFSMHRVSLKTVNPVPIEAALGSQLLMKGHTLVFPCVRFDWSRVAILQAPIAKFSSRNSGCGPLRRPDGMRGGPGQILAGAGSPLDSGSPLLTPVGRPLAFSLKHPRHGLKAVDANIRTLPQQQIGPDADVDPRIQHDALALPCLLPVAGQLAMQSVLAAEQDVRIGVVVGRADPLQPIDGPSGRLGIAEIGEEPLLGLAARNATTRQGGGSFGSESENNLMLKRRRN